MYQFIVIPQIDLSSVTFCGIGMLKCCWMKLLGSEDLSDP